MRGTKREFFPKMSYPSRPKKASFLSASEKKKQKKKYLPVNIYVFPFMSCILWPSGTGHGRGDNCHYRNPPLGSCVGHVSYKPIQVLDIYLD